MKKKLFHLAAVALSTVMIAAALTGCGSKENSEAQPTPAASGEITEAAEGETPVTEGAAEAKRLEGVKLIFTDDAFNPYRIIDEDGTLSGYDFDVLTALQDILGFDYEFVQVEFAAVLTSIGAGTADFGMTLSPTEERKETFDFTTDYYQPKSAVGALPDSGIDSWDDLKGKTIIAPSATTHAKVAYTVEGATVIEMENIALGCEEVAAGRADAIICDSVQLSVYANEYGFHTFNTSIDDHGIEMFGYTIGFLKGSEYVDDFTYALDILKENGTLTELQKKWLGEENAIEY